MVCAKCGGSNIAVSMIQISGKSKTRGTGILTKLGRAIMIFCTFGLWLLVGKRKGTTQTKFKNEKRAICSDCGKDWAVK